MTIVIIIIIVIMIALNYYIHNFYLIQFITCTHMHTWICIFFSDVDHQCRTIVYSIDASNAEDVLIERIGRLPLDTSE